MLKAKGWVKKIVTYVKMTEKALKTKMYMTVSCFAQPDFYRTLIKCPEYMTVLEALVPLSIKLYYLSGHVVASLP